MLHQCGNQVDARATAVQQGNHARDPGRCLTQAGEVFRFLNLNCDQVRLVREKTEQVERFQNADHRSAIGHHNPVHTLAQHDGHGVAQLVGWRDLDQREIAQLADRQLVQWPAVQNGTLQGGGGKNAESLGRALRITHQHTGRAMLLKQFNDRQDVGAGVDKMRRAQKGFINP